MENNTAWEAISQRSWNLTAHYHVHTSPSMILPDSKPKIMRSNL